MLSNTNSEIQAFFNNSESTTFHSFVSTKSENNLLYIVFKINSNFSNMNSVSVDFLISSFRTSLGLFSDVVKLNLYSEIDGVSTISVVLKQI